MARWLDETREDVRYAARSLWRTPGFTAVVVITLALGIGASSTIFSVVRAVLIQSLPYADADRFVRLVEEPAAGAGVGETRPAGITRTELEVLREKSHTLSHIGVYVPTSMTLTLPARAVRVNGVRLSPAILAMLREPPMLGRLFEAREEAAGLNRVVVLSYNGWQRYLEGAADAIGRILVLDGNPYTIVGVTQPGFSFPDAGAQFWIPFEWPMAARLVPTARLADDTPLEMASAEMNLIIGSMRTTGRLYGLPQPPPPPPPPPGGLSGLGPGVLPPGLPIDRSVTGPGQRSGQTIKETPPHFRFVRLQEQLMASVRPALVILCVAVGFVLLIACVNVANLLLARGAARHADLAIRVALGAGHARLVRQTLTEALLLALAGGVVGIGLAFEGLRLVQLLGTALPRRGMAPAFGLPQLDAARIDLPVLIFTFVIAIVTGVAFGVIPALRVIRPQEIGRRTREVLVVAEISLAMLLFLGAGLLMRSFVTLSSVPPGFDTAGILTFQIITPPGELSPAVREDLVTRLAAMPGVTAAGYANQLPMGALQGVVPLRKTPERSGQPPPPPTAGGTRRPEYPDLRLVSRDFLRVMGMHISDGRGFGVDDGAGHPQVMLINRTLARSGLLGPSPIGQQIYAVGSLPWEVIGIVDDARQLGLDQEPGPQIFIDLRQFPSDGTAGSTAVPPYFAVRTENPAAIATMTSAVRDLVHAMNPHATLDSIATMTQIVANSIVRQRIYAVLLAVFALVAVMLAAIGIYGVMSYVVTQRTREMGIRIALGATRGDVLRHVIGQSLTLIAVGLLVGWAGALIVTGSLAGLLFGVTTRDPLTFAVTPVVFAAIATFAAFVPARRATRVDPLIALRDL